MLLCRDWILVVRGAAKPKSGTATAVVHWVIGYKPVPSQISYALHPKWKARCNTTTTTTTTKKPAASAVSRPTVDNREQETIVVTFLSVPSSSADIRPCMVRVKRRIENKNQSFSQCAFVRWAVWWEQKRGKKTSLPQPFFSGKFCT